MNFQINPKTHMPSFTLDDGDMEDAAQVEAMMKTPGWGVYQRYGEVAREAIIDYMKDSFKSRARRESCAFFAAFLKGLDEYRLIPQKLVARADAFRTAELTKEVNANDPSNGQFGD